LNWEYQIGHGIEISLNSKFVVWMNIALSFAIQGRCRIRYIFGCIQKWNSNSVTCHARRAARRTLWLRLVLNPHVAGCEEADGAPAVCKRMAAGREEEEGRLPCPATRSGVGRDP
jgi:hypothetical protein